MSCIAARDKNVEVSNISITRTGTFPDILLMIYQLKLINPIDLPYSLIDSYTLKFEQGMKLLNKMH